VVFLFRQKQPFTIFTTIDYTKSITMQNKLLFLLLLLLSKNAFPQCWSSYSAGEMHSASIKDNGSLWMWGWNISGQMGDGTVTDRTMPTQIGTATDWVKIAANQASHTIAIKSNGTLWGWGLNQSGQAGSYLYANMNGYTMIPYQIGIDADWNSITTGNKHSMAIKNNGTLWGWGRNEDGQLGIGNYLNKDQPVQVGTDNDWVSVSAGDAHTIAIKQNGSIWAWGRNGDSQLGIGNTVSKTIPTRIGTLNAWVKVYAGGAFCMALKNDGTLWAFGNNTLGELGIGNNLDKNIPTQVGTANNWQKIATGGLHTLAIKNDGSLWSWGININGMLGDGTLVNRNYPLQVGSDFNWSDIAAGGYHSMATKTNNVMYIWGSNYGGQMGNGTSGNGTSVLVPTMLICSSLDVTEVSELDSLVFYPNPAKETIWYNPDIMFKECLALDGKKIQMTSSGSELDISSLSTGMYILVFINDDGNRIVKKLLKK
jgi:alpha-tubulin suppressor-like RCC1 family protein